MPSTPEGQVVNTHTAQPAALLHRTLSETFRERLLPRDRIDWLLAIPLTAWIVTMFCGIPTAIAYLCFRWGTTRRSMRTFCRSLSGWACCLMSACSSDLPLFAPSRSTETDCCYAVMRGCTRECLGIAYNASPKFRERKCFAKSGSGPAFQPEAPCSAARPFISSASNGRAASITSARRMLRTSCGSYDSGGQNCSKVSRAASKRRRRLRRHQDDIPGGENRH